jgi:hypothetical protein
MRSPPTQYSRISHRWLVVSYLPVSEDPKLAQASPLADTLHSCHLH